MGFWVQIMSTRYESNLGYLELPSIISTKGNVKP
jgi:hypothetical protein